jgi:hypothetical protein
MEDVTESLNRILKDHAEVGEALALIIASPLLGRETLSAALGEISEHLVARLIGGTRKDRGNNGFDLIGPLGENIEVKSRQLSRWGLSLMFDFSRHTVSASEAYCVAWDDTVSPPVVHAAFRAKVSEYIERWGVQGQSSYSIRTNLRKLQTAVEGTRAV